MPSKDAENSKGVPSSEMSFGQTGVSPTGHSAHDSVIVAKTSRACSVSGSESWSAAANAASFLSPSAPSVAPDSWVDASDPIRFESAMQE